MPFRELQLPRPIVRPRHLHGWQDTPIRVRWCVSGFPETVGVSAADGRRLLLVGRPFWEW
jgi:hypothetical protein